MSSLRKEIEEREKAWLSPFASQASSSKGRKHKDKPSPYRTCYQVDRDRILHSKAFRRLKHKTQVFISPVEDHFRTRLTHTLEVSQIARTLARALRLNEDLTEAIALGHDLGHTPFGHAGEYVLDEILRHYGKSYHHNVQSLRVAAILENDGKGLNLTREVLDGILHHPQTVSWPKTLEGCLVRMADRFAYIRHDIEDAIRAGVIKWKDLPKTPIKILGKNILDTVVSDVIGESQDKPYVRMSPKVQKAVTDMYDFLYKRVYTNEGAKFEERKLPEMLKLLFRHYHYDKDFQKGVPPREQLQHTTDFIAGMTDRYAINKFQELFIPREWRTA
jgi:dGTPase